MAVPVNQEVPVITGTAEVGETLTASTGDWTPTPQSYSFQWQRVNDNAEDIEGATNSSYIITALSAGHKLRVQVIATNNSGDSLPAYSLDTAEVPDDWFIVEDGTGKSDAVSYVSLDYAADYFAHRGIVAWSILTNGERKAALVKATDYMVQAYRDRWDGYRLTNTQSLDWPRNSVEYEGHYYPSDEVPTEVKNACCELALKATSGELLPDLTQGVVREKVDVLEVEYDKYSPQYVRYRAVDSMLSVFLAGSPNSKKVIRV